MVGPQRGSPVIIYLTSIIRHFTLDEGSQTHVDSGNQTFTKDFKSGVTKSRGTRFLIKMLNVALSLLPYNHDTWLYTVA